MPRSSGMKSTPSTSRHTPAKIPVPPPYAVAPFRPTAPTVSQTLKEGITSGIGTGIGFGIGNRISNAIFGPSTVASAPIVTAVPSPPQHVSDFQQCQHNAFDGGEKLLCMNLYNSHAAYEEFRQCMKTLDNQVHTCKEFLPQE